MTHDTSVGPRFEPLLSGARYYAIGELQAPQAHTPLAVALVHRQDQNGLAPWAADHRSHRGARAVRGGRPGVPTGGVNGGQCPSNGNDRTCFIFAG
jgi:hypothetical protein